MSLQVSPVCTVYVALQSWLLRPKQRVWLPGSTWVLDEQSEQRTWPIARLVQLALIVPLFTCAS